MTEEAVIGAVLPPEDYFEQDREGRPFEDAHANAVQALAKTQDRLAELRKLVKETYDEIRVLVDDEALLKRMVQVRKPKPD